MSPHDPGRKAETGGGWTIHHSSSTCSSLLKKDINQSNQNERTLFLFATKWTHFLLCLRQKQLDEHRFLHEKAYWKKTQCLTIYLSKIYCWAVLIIAGVPKQRLNHFESHYLAFINQKEFLVGAWQLAKSCALSEIADIDYIQTRPRWARRTRRRNRLGTP